MSTEKTPSNVFPTYGVHNPPEYSPCKFPDGIYPRAEGEPSDPTYPLYWCAKWTMYRVFGKNYSKYLPPYDGKPPAGLVEGEDYEVSYGSTYYDSTWGNGQGAMMEYYHKRSLPIFPMDNQYTSAFISLGNDAYYLTWEDRPDGMPPISHFSDLNHPPRRDFIKHLPYSKGDSDQLDGKIQGYSFWTSPMGQQPPAPPVQTGVSPDRTADQCIMFGYGFDSEWRKDDYDPNHAPYRHPNSFYFSGCPTLNGKIFAPMVSQNYTEFIAKRPDPAETWDLVRKFAQGKPIPFYNPFIPRSSQKAAQAAMLKSDGSGGCPLSGKAALWDGSILGGGEEQS